MAVSANKTIPIEENARFMLNSNSDLITDAHISNASICNTPVLSHKYNSGYQPLLSPQQHGPLYLDTVHVEDVLLNPVRHKSTISIIGPSSSYLDAEITEMAPSNASPRSTFGQNGYSSHNNVPLMSPGRLRLNHTVNEQPWTTSNWTSIFLHFHSVEHRHCIYPWITLIGTVMVIAILSTECYLLPPAHWVLTLCRFLDWVLMVMVLYLFAFVISYSTNSRTFSKKWCTLRDSLYVVFWVHSTCCFMVGMAIQFEPGHYVKYRNCRNGDIDCNHYHGIRRLTDDSMEILMVILHSLPLLFCIVISLMFSHKHSFRKWYVDVLIIETTLCGWFGWITLCFVTKREWTYQGLEAVFDRDHGGWMVMVLLMVSIMMVMFAVYWMCYVLHHRCTLCEHSYYRHFRPKALAAKMADKVKELEEMPDRDDAFESGIAL